MCTVTSASDGPALLPSYAVNATGAPTPTTRASASATGAPISSPPDSLVVQIEQPTFRVVPLAQPAVLLPAVPRGELLPVVERRGVQRLAAAQPADLGLDAAVVVPVPLAGRQRDGAPEADVDPQRAGVQVVQRPAPRVPAARSGRPRRRSSLARRWYRFSSAMIRPYVSERSHRRPSSRRTQRRSTPNAREHQNQSVSHRQR